METNPDPKKGRAPWVAALALVTAAALGGWLLLRGHSDPPAPVPAAPEPVAAQPTPAPPPADSDQQARALLGALSSLPPWAAWLGTGDLVRRFTVSVASVAQGNSPREQAPFLAPGRALSVVQRGGQAFVDPRSYERYDTVAGVFASIDARAAALAYTRLEPIFDGFYREIALPGARFRTAVAQALRRLLTVPVIEGEMQVEARPIIYRYVDPKLEALSDAEKHLLRMGPRNVRLVQGKLRELAAALQIDAG